MVIAILGVPVWHHLVGLFLLLANVHCNITVLLLDQALGFLRHRFDFIVEKKNVVSKRGTGLQANILLIFIDPKRSVLGIAYSYQKSTQ